MIDPAAVISRVDRRDRRRRSRFGQILVCPSSLLPSCICVPTVIAATPTKSTVTVLDADNKSGRNSRISNISTDRQ